MRLHGDMLGRRRGVGLLDHIVAGGEGGIDIAVAQLVVRHPVIGHALVQQRRTRRAGRQLVVEGRQRLVVDLDQGEGRLGLRERLGGDRHDGLADVAHAIDGQDRLIFVPDAIEVVQASCEQALGR